jgi:hypothetical protein
MASPQGKTTKLPPRRSSVFVGSLLALSAVSCPVVDARHAPRGRAVPHVSAAVARALSPAAGPSAPEPKARLEPKPVEEPVEPGEWPEPTAEQVQQLTAEATAAERVLVAIAKETFVFEEPSWGSRKIGYLRAGAVVRRADKPVGHSACAEGWYRIEPAGFVCVGRTASLDVSHPIATLSRSRPDPTQPLPYRYGMSRFPTPPFYAKLPRADEQLRAEPDLPAHRLRQRRDAWSDVSLASIPEPLSNGRAAPTFKGDHQPVGSVFSGYALAKSGFALLDVYEHEGRRFGLSVDLDLMPLDRLEKVAPSAFGGLELDEQTELPVAFVLQKGASLYGGHPHQGLRPERVLAFREALALTGKRARSGGIEYLETRDGRWLRDQNLSIVPKMNKKPGWATPGRTWIDVSILRQSLVAYEGERPVYVTLVSTGADGLGDPEETHSTIRGQFLIHTKHLTATMSGDELGDEFDLRDVPYVQYFTEGYALHAAYWHESFGRPRSHGCINLSPIDAKWLFHWTDPPIPEGWHGAMSLREGTLVHIHP